MQKTNTATAHLDTRSLRFLKILLQTSSVTRTAELLGISQPAASRILARLRDLTQDPLLIRTEEGYRLTDHATSLQQPVLDAISAVDVVLQPSTFYPEQSQHQFRIACTDYATTCILGPLMETLAESAPQIQIDVTPLVPNSFQMINDGEIDFVFYAALDVSGDFIAKKLFVDTYVLLMQDRHPLVALGNKKGYLDPKDITDFRKVEFNYPTVDGLHADTVLREEKTNNSAVFRTPYFASMPYLVGTSNAVAAAPSRLGEQLSKFTNIYSVPFRTGSSFPYYLIWHERGRHNPAIAWFVSQIAKTVNSDR